MLTGWLHMTFEDKYCYICGSGSVSQGREMLRGGEVETLLERISSEIHVTTLTILSMQTSLQGAQSDCPAVGSARCLGVVGLVSRVSPVCCQGRVTQG